jgi:hypothetical protein
LGQEKTGISFDVETAAPRSIGESVALICTVADGAKVGVAVGVFVSPICDGVEVGAEVEVGAADGTKVGVAVGAFVSPT